MADSDAVRPSFLPSKNVEYLKTQYWDSRFSEEEEYDWFKGYSEFRHLLLRHVEPNDRVLILGCGNSRLSEELFLDGVCDVTSTDLSPVVVERMRQRCEGTEREAIRWEVADMLDLPYQPDSYDVVIEKGALDVFFVDNESPWDPSPAVRKRVQSVLEGVHRVLTENGKFISITFGQPHFRRPLFETEQFTWSMEYETFGDSFHYFLYALTKGKARESQIKPEKETTPKMVEDMEHEYMDDEECLLQKCFLE